MNVFADPTVAFGPLGAYSRGFNNCNPGGCGEFNECSTGCGDSNHCISGGGDDMDDSD